jgi:hypothetical protein
MPFKIPSVKWTKIPLEEATTKYNIEKASKGVLLDELFGEEPDNFYVHVGNVSVAGKLLLNGMPESPEPTVYVIDGNLAVDGPFVFENLDVYTTLYVTGSVTATNMAVTWDACLIIGNTLSVDDMLYTYLTDAGNLIVRKGLSAKLWLEAGGRGNISAAKSKTTQRLVNGSDEGKRDAVTPVLLPTYVDDDQPDQEKIKAAILKGKTIVKR